MRKGALAELVDRIHVHGKQLKRVERFARKKPEYTFALFLAVASEGISLLRGWRNDTVFHKILLSKYGASPAVSRAVFRAVRHGLAHRYDTSLIHVDGTQIVVVVTWKDASRHLTFTSGDWLHDGKRRLGLWLDVHSMWKDLDAYAMKLAQAVKRDQKLVKDSQRRANGLAQEFRVCVEDADAASWQQFLTARAR